MCCLRGLGKSRKTKGEMKRSCGGVIQNEESAARGGFLCYVLYGETEMAARVGMKFGSPHALGSFRTHTLVDRRQRCQCGLHLPVRRWANAVAVRWRHQPAENLPADGVSASEAIGRPRHSAERDAAGWVTVRTGPGLRHLGQVRVGTGLPLTRLGSAFAVAARDSCRVVRSARRPC